VIVLGQVYYHLFYEEGDSFPSHLGLFIIHLTTTTLEIEGYLEVGMRGELKPHPPLGSSAETLIFRILRIEDESQRVLAQVEKPVNIPIRYDYIYSLGTRLLGGHFDATTPTPPRWATLYVLTGLDLSADIALDSDTWLVKLTDADVAE